MESSDHMAGEEMAALALLQKQVADLKNAIYYLTEKLGAAPSGAAPSGDVVAALEALSKEVKALGDQVGYVSRLSSDGFASIKGVADKITAVSTPQQVAAIGEKVDSLAKAIPSSQTIVDVSKKVDAVAENVGYVARQSSDTAKKLDSISSQHSELGSKIDAVSDSAAKQSAEAVKKMEGAVSQMTESAAKQSAEVALKLDASVSRIAKRLDEAAAKLESSEVTSKIESVSAKLDKMSEQSGAQSKQAELLSETLALMSKELNNAKKSYADLSAKIESLPASQQVDSVLAAVDKMNAVQSIQEKKLASLTDALTSVLKQLSEGQETKHTELLSETLALMSKELNAVKATYSDLSKKLDSFASSQQSDRLVASMVRMAESQAAQEKKLNTVLDSLSDVSKRVGQAGESTGTREQFEKLTALNMRVVEAMDAQKRNTEIIANAMSTVVKELTTLEKGVAAVEKAMAMVPSYQEMEKRVFTKLTEKMSGA